MDLVSFSIRTKGLHNFTRRLWTVFTRFGFSEARSRAALRTIVGCLRENGSAPTFFIPAVVLGRHPALLHEIAAEGAEIGIHGYVHNDYRTLTRQQQLDQTADAIALFERVALPFEGFRNPYLGWTEDSVRVFEELGFTYESNEAVLHDVVQPDALPTRLRAGYLKSLSLFQAIECSAYTLRPHVEGTLVRIPTSIPDDEMLFDRLRITDPAAVGRLWSSVLRRVYDLGGIYVLNLHPERGVLCRQALATLLASAREAPLPIWLTPLRDVAAWWRERQTFRLAVTPLGAGRWQIEAECSPRATVLARHVAVEGAAAAPWFGREQRVDDRRFSVRAERCPAVAIAPDTPWEVVAFLQEQGYPCLTASPEDAGSYAVFVELPEGFGMGRAEQMRRRRELVDHIERADTPLVRFGLWPDSHRAALSITGDIDSVTIQDFFRRIVEVRSPGPREQHGGAAARPGPRANADAPAHDDSRANAPT
ncbi:MAG: polysaccharide deacetylase family protein [Ktedonobacterales bacterium]